MLQSCRKHPCHCSTVLHPVLCIQPGLGCQATLCCAHGVICVHLQHDLGIVRAELRAVQADLRNSRKKETGAQMQADDAEAWEREVGVIMYSGGPSCWRRQVCVPAISAIELASTVVSHLPCAAPQITGVISTRSTHMVREPRAFRPTLHPNLLNVATCRLPARPTGHSSCYHKLRRGLTMLQQGSGMRHTVRHTFVTGSSTWPSAKRGCMPESGR